MLSVCADTKDDKRTESARTTFFNHLSNPTELRDSCDINDDDEDDEEKRFFERYEYLVKQYAIGDVSAETSCIEHDSKETPQE